jgi:ubiquinone/menaquinone biosynthesis C-methylase UbiE
MNEITVSPTRIRVNNWYRRSILKRWLVRSFYNKFNTVLDDRRALMNWGFAPLDQGQQLQLDGQDEFQRYQLQMYYQVAAGVGIAGMSALEVGSGRGGGADFLVRTFNPASYVGVDLSEANVAFCNKRFARERLLFRRGDAQALPFPDETFDRVINVESSHCYPKPEIFLQEVYRVLRPGGYLLMSDFRDTADTVPPSTESRATLLSQMKQPGFEIQTLEDITPNVLASLDLDHDRKRAALESMSELHRKRMGDVVKWAMALKDGPIYKDFQEGRKCYLRFVCRKHYNGSGR